MKSQNIKELNKWLNNLLKEERHINKDDIIQILNDFDWEEPKIAGREYDTITAIILEGVFITYTEKEYGYTRGGLPQECVKKMMEILTKRGYEPQIITWNASMQKTADIDFLVKRTMEAGTCNFTDERDTGSSSNSIVAIAYGAQELKDQILPGDMGDLNACKNMWKKLPEHRKTEDAKKAMERAENFRNEKTIF